MTESLNAQGTFLSYAGSISGSLGLGILQANPYLTSVWINYQSPYISARWPQGSVGFSASLRTAVTDVLGKEALVFSKQALAPPGTNYTKDELRRFGEDATREHYRSQSYIVSEEPVPTQGG